MIEMQEKFENINASMKKKIFFRRYVYDTVWWIWWFLRLRTDWESTTLTHKLWDVGRKYAEETEVIVNDFDQTHALLAKLWIVHATYQENRRTVYAWSRCEIVLDEWPGIPPYCEIEWPTEEEVYACAAALGYTTHEDYFYWSTDLVYKQYFGQTFPWLSSFPELTFETDITKYCS